MKIIKKITKQIEDKNSFVMDGSAGVLSHSGKSLLVNCGGTIQCSVMQELVLNGGINHGVEYVVCECETLPLLSLRRLNDPRLFILPIWSSGLAQQPFLIRKYARIYRQAMEGVIQRACQRSYEARGTPIDFLLNCALPGPTSGTASTLATYLFKINGMNSINFLVVPRPDVELQQLITFTVVYDFLSSLSVPIILLPETASSSMENSWGKSDTTHTDFQRIIEYIFTDMVDFLSELVGGSTSYGQRKHEESLDLNFLEEQELEVKFGNTRCKELKMHFCNKPGNFVVSYGRGAEIENLVEVHPSIMPNYTQGDLIVLARYSKGLNEQETKERIQNGLSAQGFGVDSCFCLPGRENSVLILIPSGVPKVVDDILARIGKENLGSILKNSCRQAIKADLPYMLRNAEDVVDREVNSIFISKKEFERNLKKAKIDDPDRIFHYYLGKKYRVYTNLFEKMMEGA